MYYIRMNMSSSNGSAHVMVLLLMALGLTYDAKTVIEAHLAPSTKNIFVFGSGMEVIFFTMICISQNEPDVQPLAVGALPE